MPASSRLDIGLAEDAFLAAAPRLDADAEAPAALRQKRAVARPPDRLPGAVLAALDAIALALRVGDPAEMNPSRPESGTTPWRTCRSWTSEREIEP